MSDLTSYRFITSMEWERLGRPEFAPNGPGVLVPDPRLRALADAWSEYRRACLRAPFSPDAGHKWDALESHFDALITEDASLVSSADQREVPHEFTGRLDRWCTSCNLPDRNSIHRLASTEEGK